MIAMPISLLIIVASLALGFGAGAAYFMRHTTHTEIHRLDDADGQMREVHLWEFQYGDVGHAWAVLKQNEWRQP